MALSEVTHPQVSRVGRIRSVMFAVMLRQMVFFFTETAST